MGWKKDFHGKIDVFSVYFEAICWKDYMRPLFGAPTNLRFRYVDGDFYYWEEDQEKIKEDLLKNPFDKIPLCHQILEESSLNFLHFCEQLGSDFSHKTNQELLELFYLFCEEYKKTMCGWQHPIFIEEVLTLLLQKHLQELINPEKDYLFFKEILSSLFIPVKETEMLKEKKELLQMAVDGATESSIENHAKKYAYLGMMLLSGKLWTKDYFKERLKEIKHPRNELEQIQQSNQATSQPLLSKIKELSFLKLVKLAKEISYLRTFHLEQTNKGCFYARPFLTEIGRRMKVSYESLICHLPEEIEDFLKNGTEPNALVRAERESGYVIVNNPQVQIFTGEDAESFKNEYTLKIESVQEISGSIANKGKVRGIVKVLHNTTDLRKVEKGDIIVAQVTTPDFVPAMEKAAAFVTDIGGITCHAAIVAREMGKPCIIGTEIATKVLKDGDLVEVDAEKGIVRKINK